MNNAIHHRDAGPAEGQDDERAPALAPAPLETRTATPLWRQLLTSAQSASSAILNTIYPPVCLHCRLAIGAPHALCPACWGSLGFITRPYCERLGVPFAIDPGAVTVSPAAIAAPPPWARARAVVRYDGVARDLVHAMKFGDRPDVAILLGRMMATAGGELASAADVVIPIPLHRWRLWRRRFNQSVSLAATISSATGAPMQPALLRRIRATTPQVGLARTARASNLRGAFALAPGARRHIAGKRALLVDDVMTSGATAAAATRVLLREGAAAVDVLTFALVLRD